MQAEAKGRPYRDRAGSINGLEQLTPREAAVALAWAGGRSVESVAAELGVTPGVVNADLAEVCRKLGVPESDALRRTLWGADGLVNRPKLLLGGVLAS